MNKATGNITDIRDRYIIETDLLPRILLGREGILAVISILEDKGSFFVKLFDVIDSKCPYSANDFYVENIVFDKDHSILEITMPEPERARLCEMLMIAVDSEVKKIRYLTVERTVEGGKFLCEWEIEKNGNDDDSDDSGESNESYNSGKKIHSNYGDFSRAKVLDVLGWRQLSRSNE